MSLIRGIYSENQIIEAGGNSDTISGITLSVSSHITPYDFKYNVVRRGTRGAIVPVMQWTERFCKTSLIIDNENTAIYAQRRCWFKASYTYKYGTSTTPTTVECDGRKYTQHNLLQNNAPALPWGFKRIMSLIPKEDEFETKPNGTTTTKPITLTASLQRNKEESNEEEVNKVEVMRASNLPIDTIIDFVINDRDNIDTVSLHSNGLTSIEIQLPSISNECAAAILWYIDSDGRYQPQLLKSITYNDTTHGSQPTRHYLSGARVLYPNTATQRSFTAEFIGNKKLYDNLALTSGDVYYLGLPTGELLTIDCTGVTRSGMVIIFNGTVGL